MTLVAKCRIDSFRLTGTESICHMFLLNVEFSNSRVGFGFSSVTFRLYRVSVPAFSVTPALTRTNRVLEVVRIYTKHSKCCDKFSC